MRGFLQFASMTFACLAGSSVLAPAAQATSPVPRERSFEFEYTATVKDVPGGAQRLEVWIPVPHDNPYQTITGLHVESAYPYHIDTASYGNKILHLQVDHPTSPALAVTLHFTALRKEHLQERLADPKAPATDTPDPDMARWLQPDRLVPIDGRIRQWAQEIVQSAGAKTDMEKLRAIYSHVVATVKYDKRGEGWGRGDIYYACDARRGNCTDFHAMVIGYSRALGIPARFAIGFPLPAARGVGQVAGYHCWAEAYIKGIGWVPIDASEAAKNPAKREYFFGAHDENRVEFSVGRDLVLTPKQAGEPLNYFIYPYVEVDGKPFATVDRSFSYRDEPSATATSGAP